MCGWNWVWLQTKPCSICCRPALDRSDEKKIEVVGLISVSFKRRCLAADTSNSLVIPGERWSGYTFFTFSINSSTFFATEFLGRVWCWFCGLGYWNVYVRGGSVYHNFMVHEYFLHKLVFMIVFWGRFVFADVIGCVCSRIFKSWEVSNLVKHVTHTFSTSDGLGIMSEESLGLELWTFRG